MTTDKEVDVAIELFNNHGYNADNSEHVKIVRAIAKLVVGSKVELTKDGVRRAAATILKLPQE